MKSVPKKPIEPLAHRIPAAAARAGMAETKFRQYIKDGRVGFVPYGKDRLIPDTEIQRLLQEELTFESGEQA